LGGHFRAGSAPTMPVASHPERPLDCLLPVFCVILGQGWAEGRTIASRTWSGKPTV
jgi:hypothetical protein